MGLKFRRGTTAQKSGSLAFGEPYVNTTLGTLQVGGPDGDITLGSTGTGSTGTFGAISGSGLDITGNANIAGNLTLGGQLTIGDQTSDTVNVVASLSSSLIPSETNAFDLGSATKIWKDLYISTGSIKFVEGTTVVKTLNAETLTNLEAATGSSNVAIENLNTTTASLNNSIIDLNIYTSSLKSALSVVTNNLEVFNDLIVSGNLQTNRKAIFNPEFGGVALEVTGSSVFGNNSAQLVEISGSLKTNQKATFAPDFGGTALEITGGVEINNGLSYPVVISDNFIVSGSTILGTDSNDTISISGSLQSNQKVILTTQFGGNALEITGGVVIDNGPSYPVSIKNDLEVTGSLTATTLIGSISATNGVVSGSSQVTLSSTTGGGTSADVQFGSLGIGMAASGVSGEIKATGDIIAFASSDNRLKENIKPIENALDKVSKISGNTYDWKTGFEEIHSHTGEDVGVIAQEIEAVLPQLVTTREHGYKAVQYEKLTALLIEAIKEQQTQIHSLTLEIEKLKEQKGL